MIKNNIEKKTWQEFRATGIMLIVNTILHAFGWVIVMDIKDGEIITAYPARTTFRGFSEKDQSDSYEKIADYLSKTSSDFPEEIK